MRTDNPDEDVDPSTAGTDRQREATRADPAELEHRVERLQARNQRLRNGIDRSRRHRLRLAALGFAGLGLLSFAAAFAVPAERGVLFALAGVGLFAGVLTTTMTGGRFVDGDDAARVYGTCAANYDAILASRDLSSTRFYVPAGDGDRVRLFVPTDADDAPPTDGDGLGLGPDEDGLALEPIGTEFVRELEDALPDEAAATPESTVEQVCDALEARFEFATAAEPTVDRERGRAEIAVSGSAFGTVDRFDHPVASILAVGLARALERPIRLTVSDDTDRGEWLVRCEWDAEAEEN